ncbi:MAG: SUMF1/EgtB/PvdO family nonheme iron enzyme [Candidatus Wallbacteria bacterium]|nr:SUMF1/EgtB/PvdO family nonheme iron enzyme [Candidatus Wallbacteria bacterium]
MCFISRISIVLLMIMLTSVMAGVSVSGSAGGLAGARVKLWKTSSIIKEATADSNGNFTLTGISSGIYMLMAYKGGYYPGSLQLIVNDQDQNGIMIPVSPIPQTRLSNLGMNIYGTAEVDHDGDGTLEAVIPGDVVTAKDPQGILCGQFTVNQAGRYGTMPIVGDDPETATDEGCNNADNVALFVNGAHVSGTLPFSNMEILEKNISAAAGMTRSIPLKTGWNLVSLGLIPDTDSIETLFSGIDRMRYVMGFFRNPADNGSEGFRTFMNLPGLKAYSTLTDLDAYHGYWVYMTGDDTLELSGIRVADNSSRTMSQGWNLVGYWLDSTNALPTYQGQANTTIDSIFGSTAVSGEVKYVMGFYRFPPDGGTEGFRTFMNTSALNFSTLKELTPKLGYWMYMLNEGLLQYGLTASALAAPSWINASDAAYTTEVRVTWNIVTGAACYQVFRADSSTGTYLALSPQLTETRYDDPTVGAGILYFYKVKAINNSGETSLLSDCDSGYAALTTANNPPWIASVEVTGTSGGITISYSLSDPDNDTCSVRVFYSIDDGYSYTGSVHVDGTLEGILPGSGKTVTWNSNQDIADTQNRVRVKIIPNDGKNEGSAGESGMFTVNNGKELTSIVLTPSMIYLDPGHSYDLTGLKVIAAYSDGSSREVTGETWIKSSGRGTIENNIYTSPSDTGNVMLTASYMEGAVSKTSELSVTVGIKPSSGAVKTVTLTGEVTMDFVWIPAGSFNMGSPVSETLRHSDEGPQHTVNITGFWMSRYEVTQAQWQGIMGSNPSNFSGPSRPVDGLSWNDCQGFITALNSKEIGSFRLPTEAEWEYACRAGTTTAYYWGGSMDIDYCWYYYETSGYQTHDVGLKLPNAWGLYDMSGNVWEWCNDWYSSSYYSTSPADDPPGPASGQFGYRVVRGGSWSCSDFIERSANRDYVSFDYQGHDFGMRLCLNYDGTGAALPSSPTGLTASGKTNSSFTLAWNSVGCAAGYNVFKGGTLYATTETTSKVITGLSANTSYTMEVTAVNVTGESEKSTALIVTTNPDLPAAPSGLSSSSMTSNSFTLAWNSVDCAACYNVYKGGTLYATTETTSKSITGLSASTSYTMEVSAVNVTGEGAKSPGLSLTTNPDLPATPAGLSISDMTTTGFTLSWNPVPYAAGYKIYMGGTLHGTTEACLTNFTGLSAGTGYTMEVSAVNSAGEGAKSAALFWITNKNVVLSGEVSMEFVWIPSGSFTMGSPVSDTNSWTDERPQHTVNITRGFWLGKYKVTQSQWQALTGNNPSCYQGTNYPNSGNRPVEQVSWTDCQAFIATLNSKGVGTFRLPTEAEWEYACRAKMTTIYYWGANFNGNYMWYSENSGNQTHDVGLKLPNAWGLYDMIGNLWELCNDWYDGCYYTSSAATDPQGPASGTTRVMRGGSWGAGIADCRSAARCDNTVDGKTVDIGFRLAGDLSGIPAPTGLLSSDKTTTSFTLNWSAVSDAASYVICKDGSFYGTSETNSKLISGLTAGTSYSMEVSAVDAAGKGLKSTALNITTNKILNLTGEVSMEFVWIPAGSFAMGSPTSETDSCGDERPQHTVNINHGYWLGKYEITQSQWQAVRGSNPSYFQGTSFPNSGNRPVEQVSWTDCQTLITLLNSKGSGTFRLPTEAEWEYACRAGTASAYYWGGTLSMNYGWIDDNSSSQTHDVGLKLPNAWGLYDMIGNILEWCNDWYGDNYKDMPEIVDDPQGETSGGSHVMRGNSWYDLLSTSHSRSAYRYYNSDNTHKSYGARLVYVEAPN